MEDGNLANLITGGLSFALMSADSSAKAALKPMNIVSRELRKRNPDLELVERASMYGGNELDHAGEALARAREELEESQKAAVQEKKAEMEARLEEKTAEKAAEREAEKEAEREQAAGDNLRISGNGASDSPASGGHDQDRAEISEKAARAVQERVRMGFAAAEDSGAEASTGQKGAAAELGLKISARERYSAMAFRDRVSRMRMDLRG